MSSSDKIGPKERALREQRERLYNTKGAGAPKRASSTELRGQIAKIKPKPPKQGRRGR